ncbi:MAG: IS4 family transposase, partial [Planctomycetaceae bacterium]|nr:IS4 family transposase [Planctomycetaceae bacterium]
DPNASKLSREEKHKQRIALPIEEKESLRWLESIRTTKKIAEECPETQCVNINDSEGDIFELFVEPRTTDNFHWIIRAGQDRAVLDIQGDSLGMIRDALLQQPVLATHEVSVRARKQKISCEKSSRRTARVSRQAFVEVRAGVVTIRKPARCKTIVGPATVNVVLVREPNPPPGEVPIEWILLTTLPISTLEEVLAIIRYYTIRWMIEIYFRTLKSGCRIEERRFETLPQMLACTAIYLIVAWRTLYVCRLGRSCPDIPCDLVFDPSEWQSVWSVTHPGEAIPLRVPPLSEMVRLIASLGGYVARGSVALPPGVETVWKGLQRMRDLAWGWETFGPGKPQRE